MVARVNGHTLHRVSRADYGSFENFAAMADGTRYASPDGQSPQRAFVLGIVLHAVEDIAGWMNRKRDRSHTKFWQDRVRTLRYRAFMADQWFHGYANGATSRMSFADCCALLGFLADDFRSRIYEQWPTESFDEIRSLTSVNIARWELLRERPPVVEQEPDTGCTLTWSYLFDGDEHRLISGLDFTCQPNVFIRAAHTAASRLRVGITARTARGVVYMQRVCGELCEEVR